MATTQAMSWWAQWSAVVAERTNCRSVWRRRCDSHVAQQHMQDGYRVDIAAMEHINASSTSERMCNPLRASVPDDHVRTGF